MNKIILNTTDNPNKNTMAIIILISQRFVSITKKWNMRRLQKYTIKNTKVNYT